MVEVKPGGAKCLVLGDSIVRNVGATNANMKVQCFPGIRTDQLRRVMENRDFGCRRVPPGAEGKNQGILWIAEKGDRCRQKDVPPCNSGMAEKKPHQEYSDSRKP
jgi:hypothetical protein